MTWGSLAALAAGLICGIAESKSSYGPLASLISAIQPIGRLWMSTLWITVLPLLATMLVVAVASSRSSLLAGRLGVLSTATAVSMIAVGVVVTVIVTRTILAAWPIGLTMQDSLSGLAPAALVGAAGSASGTAGETPAILLPGRFIKAAADVNLVMVLVGAMLVGLLITLMPVRPRERVIRIFQRLHDVMLRIVRIILLLTPFGVFSLTVGFATRGGVQAAGTLGYMFALVGGLLLAYTAACYPLAAVIGGVPMRRFARAVLPSQVFALGTRSSVAGMPLLVEACERVDVPPTVSRFVLPMMVSVFKITRTIGAAKLLMLAALYGVHIGPFQLLMFVLIETAVGSSPGLPQMGILTAPAYVASGIPLEGLLLFSAVDTLIDTQKALLNVTGAVTASMIVARISRLWPASAPGGMLPAQAISPAASAQ